MHKFVFRGLSLCILPVLCVSSHADSEAVADARALALGGARVAYTRSPQQNPAALSSQGDKQFYWEWPSLAVQLLGHERLAAAARGDYALSDYIHGVKFATKAFVHNTLNEPGLVSGQQRFMLKSVQRLSQFVERADIADSMSLNLPNPAFGAGVFAQSYGSGARNLLDNGQRLDRASFIQESGLALSRQFAVYGDVAFGIAPKRLDIWTYERKADAADNVYDASAERVTHTFNLDFGVMRRYETGWALGGTVTNILPQQVTPASGESFQLTPNVRFGLALRESHHLYALDIDITDQTNWVDSSKRRYFSLGTEYQWRALLFRAGYRHNLAATGLGVGTVGLGLRYASFFADTAVAGNLDEIGATARFGFMI